LAEAEPQEKLCNLKPESQRLSAMCGGKAASPHALSILEPTGS